MLEKNQSSQQFQFTIYLILFVFFLLRYHTTVKQRVQSLCSVRAESITKIRDVQVRNITVLKYKAEDNYASFGY